MRPSLGLGDILAARKDDNGAMVSGMHLFAFGRSGELLLNLSEGDFGPEEWEEACKEAEGWWESVAAGAVEKEGGDVGERMDVDGKEEDLNAGGRRWLVGVMKEDS
jgi:exosome complex component RRP46